MASTASDLRIRGLERVTERARNRTRTISLGIRQIGLPVEQVRPIRDEISRRVQALLADLDTGRHAP
jgi:hypothetical protein